MKARIFSGALFIGMILTLSSFDIPNGWFITGRNPKSYQMGVDTGSGKDGKDAMTIKSIEKNIEGFSTLATQCRPDKYFGKRVRLTGYIKTKEVSSWAGFWFRVDGETQNEVLAFDNMKDGKTDRSITGTTGWRQYEIVLDVPFNAKNILYGALLSGTGQIWFEQVKLEIVDAFIPTTGK
jgi:hypothetical protein